MCWWKTRVFPGYVLGIGTEGRLLGKSFHQAVAPLVRCWGWRNQQP